MKPLLQRVAAFIFAVIDDPSTSETVRDAAQELQRDVIDAINGNEKRESEKRDDTTD